MSLNKKFREWLELYLKALCVTLVVILFGSLLYATVMSIPFFDALRLALSLAMISLVGIGIASMLPLSEFAYTSPYGRGRAGVNPVIVREGADHARKDREPRKLGKILGLVGLTLILVYFLIFP